MAGSPTPNRCRKARFRAFSSENFSKNARIFGVVLDAMRASTESGFSIADLFQFGGSCTAVLQKKILTRRTRRSRRRHGPPRLVLRVQNLCVSPSAPGGGAQRLAG